MMSKLGNSRSSNNRHLAKLGFCPDRARLTESFYQKSIVSILDFKPQINAD